MEESPRSAPLILWSLIYVLLRTIMIIVPPLSLEDAFLESYSVVRNAEVRAMYHVWFAAVDCFDICRYFVICVCTHLTRFLCYI